MRTKTGRPNGVGESSDASNGSEPRGKETIIVVHGTFASPRDSDPGVPGGQPVVAKWYMPGGSFCRQLDAYLAELGSGARTWKHLDEGHEGFFRWSGGNSWQARSAAADSLATYLRGLAAREWTCHVIAHSHGGNVVIEAIRKLGWLEGHSKPDLGNLYLLGTPIYALRRLRRMPAWAALSTASIVTPMAVLLHDLTSAPSLVGYIVQTPVVYWLCGLVACILLSRIAISFKRSIDEWARDFAADASGVPRKVARSFFVAVSSRSDEAYQLLQGLRNAQNPLGHVPLRLALIIRDATTLTQQFDRYIFGVEDLVSRATGLITLGLLGALVLQIWSGYSMTGFWLATLVASYAVLGAASFTSALRGLALPVRLLIGSYKMVTGIAQAVLSVLLANRIWETIRVAALGTSGAPFATADLAISRGNREEPVLTRPMFYEELAPDVVARVIANRDRGAIEAIQEVLHRVDAPEGLADAVEALKETATNVTLVHAAYYAEPSAIKLLAQWIAAPPTERLIGKDDSIRDAGLHKMIDSLISGGAERGRPCKFDVDFVGDESVLNQLHDHLADVGYRAAIEDTVTYDKLNDTVVEVKGLFLKIKTSLDHEPLGKALADMKEASDKFGVRYDWSISIDYSGRT